MNVCELSQRRRGCYELCLLVSNLLPEGGDIAFFALFGYTSHTMVVRMRSTRSHTGNRRSHDALVAARLTVCKDCGGGHLRHHVCENCGKYKGMQILDVHSKLAKKEKKSKEKTKAQGK